MTEDLDVSAVEEFGPYLVYERLGVGGMATVHRALERGIEDFERVVALKRLLPHLAEDASFIKSFVREAKLASTLQHPNIVQTLELGRVGASYFISMEYIDGRDVRKILRHARKVSGPPPINVTLALMLQMCDALDYAHNRTDSGGNPLGIVHRDLSPSNLLLTRGGHLKVIDFGIAKAQAAHLATQTGRVKGKLAYMAPESIAGKELDARSDLFAAGVVFHELLTARPLFAQKNEYQTLLKVQRGDVQPPSTFNEGVPKEIDDIVLKLLAREPEDRWLSAAALRDALVTVRMSRQLSATPRDVQAWCEWAFSLDIGGFSGKTGTEAFSSGLVSAGAFTGTATPVPLNTPLPLPRRPSSPGHPSHAQQAQHADDEAAVEVAWGAAELDHGVAHLHDEVPDVSGKLSAVMMAAGGEAVIEANTDEHRFDPALLDAAATTQPEMQAMQSSTIKTHAVPPPGGRSEVRPAAFPNGSSEDALVRARPRSTSKQRPVTMPAGSSPPSQRRAPTASEPPAVAARGSTMNLFSGLDSGDEPPPVPPHMTRPQRAVTSPGPTIGASIAARPTHHLRNTIIALAVLAAAATAVTLAVVMKDDEVAPKAAGVPTVEPLPRANGTLKFVIDPSDATIKVDAEPAQIGSPWQIQLPAGLHQVEINRDGYKSWLTSIELSSSETQTLRVVLEKIAGGGTGPAMATLIVDPSVPGMEVTLDGNLLEQKTPVKVEVEPGPHTVALRQDGVDVWSEDFKAVANATHEFDPSMSDDKKRERKHRQRNPAVAAAEPPRQDWVYSPAKPIATTTAPGTTTPPKAAASGTTTPPATTTTPATTTPPKAAASGSTTPPRSEGAHV